MAALKLITEKAPITSALRFSHLGIASSNLHRSADFFSKIGFTASPAGTNEHIAVMKNRGGLELHIFECDKNIEDEKNLLMDFPESKYPGHTHVAFTVPSVPAVRSFFEGVGIQISGERGSYNRALAAVFVRDPDRTVFEFEKNYGEDEIVIITSDMIGYPQCMDHVGIRVSNPEEKWTWYAEKLGFNRHVSKYEAASEPLQNKHPWISRTESGIDINFLLNANMPTNGENVLCRESEGGVRPGIVFVALEVENVDAAEEGLRAAGVEVARDSQLDDLPWGLKSRHINTPPDGKSIFIRDSDYNVLRLVSSTQSSSGGPLPPAPK
mmetsp:Transcript_8930/g.13409  ORF Transcript_8930/g.13409 Transcript_8930/m.13409 type:complete len:325 (-) Transcript_8930:278-1252(-)|eukprot:CAMPEP_0185021178 /NCGR_PEP_ID=MMETSP1103-20130426/3856_1 /TAXON_ID=36769 /ORGANISM="Paraphysomonas bandaiensis, Strain Caron Lab Isolate" /LENGTH=324 /DNA_ID=CAMNT_0027552545 /DNA_START=40 /DNA_END=1014 /DNA_ORIENTATION=-